MTDHAAGSAPDPAALRAARRDDPKARDRDLAERLDAPEAALVAAHVGAGDGMRALPLDPRPDALIPMIGGLAEVMALTRNAHCVIETVGRYDDWTPGEHAAMVLSPGVDLRIFPRHWAHAYSVERETPGGVMRSVQAFDAAGDAVHKVFLREGSDLAGWEALRLALGRPDAPAPAFAPRAPTEAAQGDAAKADTLRREWARMSDSHQFLRMVSKLKMNRLGAYRMAGEPFARRLAPGAVRATLEGLAARGFPAMVFVGNRGCIQIHAGPIRSLEPMGPWLNVMDPGFNLHLREDRVAEVWLVEKPTRRGPALSVEAFAADGDLILQVFGYRKPEVDHVPDFDALANTLSVLPETVA
ncbi:hemin-degrading factor [Rubrimonas cliftonensis]|uniref:Putative hemin transport protein n=1 Tax=Rubrimonas cliftonensis TaxID=89524 RepID=A0A1H4EZ36_9RHOB|nr:ChuX/HutX family heme-like substrate-binding protein [Rubrimonas cliftonensis]SEA90293.1 putative hemin transport protein [Rubrimonas cliftonensis]